MAIFKNQNFFFSFFVLISLFSTSIYAAETLIFSAPPREPLAKGVKTYAPIAKLLSEITGKKVIYKHPGNWPNYTMNMRKKKYDFIFDGPHFVSWRVKYLKHRPAIKIPGDFMFVFAAKKDNPKVNRLIDVIGKKTCGHAPPNHGTLRLYYQLNNPVRQPNLIAIKGWRNIYKAMMRGRCDVAILPLKIYNEMDPDKSKTKIIFSSRPTAGQALTVSSKFSEDEFKKIRTILLSDKGQRATKNLQTRFVSKALVSANPSDYKDEYVLLRNTFGFEIN